MSIPRRSSHRVLTAGGVQRPSAIAGPGESITACVLIDIPFAVYCRATASWNRSAAAIMWSASVAAASTSIWTQLTVPLNALSRGP